MRRLSLGIFLGFLCLAGCGYQLRGRETNLPPGIYSVAVPIFANRTDQTGIETEVTRALVEKFISTKRLSVGPRNSADSLLTGTVKSFTTFPVAVVSSTQSATEYRATVILEYSFQGQKDGKVLFREEISEWRNYPVVSDLNVTEQNKLDAIRSISVLLAERIHEQILGGF
ncbi:MAG TPA: LptE family protein [Thermodesulfobacteriota bacterium]|nr:LptE family protein [Thermodesulfobacteriota bacterium]